MWPFKCKKCKELENQLELTEKISNFHKKQLSLAKLKWVELGVFNDALDPWPPIKTNLLVANKDFTYFGFLYMEDGWDQSRKINMQSKDKVWPCYTNPESISWWLNLDLIGK
jgi:hypothetical protein